MISKKTSDKNEKTKKKKNETQSERKDKKSQRKVPRRHQGIIESINNSTKISPSEGFIIYTNSK